MSIKEDIMITVDRYSEDHSGISQILRQWSEITDFKTQWQRVINKLDTLEATLEEYYVNYNTNYYLHFDALVILSQCPNSKERTDIEEIIIIDLMTLIFTPIFTPETI
jgi:cytochrome oxidase Cu insertion factor (SCO1/SenC/PrrC family)